MLLQLVVKIEQVGGGSLADLAGPALVAAAAVVAAFVAARTANARQRQQLDHDLVVRSIEHVRDAIDQAVEMVHDALLAFLDLEEAIPVPEQVNWSELEAKLRDGGVSQREKSEIRLTVSSQRAAVRQAYGQAQKRIDDLRRPIMRLRLRLGKDHEIPVLLKSLQGRWVSMSAGFSLDAGRAGEISTDRLVLRQKELLETSDVYDEFLSACHRWLISPGGATAGERFGVNREDRPDRGGERGSVSTSGP